MSNPSPAEQIQQLINQQNSLLTTKAMLAEQGEATDKELAYVRAALQGVQLGRALAEQEAAKIAADAKAAEAPAE